MNTRLSVHKEQFNDVWHCIVRKSLLVGLWTLGGAVLASTSFAAAPTLTTITVDGDMSDWAAVFANPLNYATDAEGISVADRDYPPAMPADRDLRAFAFTWDNTNLYFYVRRTASVPLSVPETVIYIDTDNDDVMESTDFVLAANWNALLNVILTATYDYVPAIGSGDDMLDGSGFADGYTLPGTIGILGWSLVANGSSPSGLEAEFAVPWTQIGLPAGSPISLHASMAGFLNIPASIDDNMGATGGGRFSTGYRQLDLSAGTTVNALNGDTLVFVHTIDHVGNLDGTVVELSHTWSCAGTPTVAYYIDTNGNSTLEPGTDLLLTDSNADTRPDTVMNWGDTITLLVEVTFPAITQGTTCNLDIRAEPFTSPTCGDTETNIINVLGPDMILVKGVNAPTATPGQALTYTTSYQNAGTDTAFVVVILDQVPNNTTFVPGSATGPGTTMEYSHDGGSNYDAFDTLPVTHVRWSLTGPLVSGGLGSVSFQVTID